MPLVTFRCTDPGCGEQVTERLTYFLRRADEPDRMKPWPSHHKTKMTPIQIDYVN